MSGITAPQFADLLERALTEPGIVSAAYSAFHGYSIGNQVLALLQCLERGIAPGPIATFKGWKDKGRYVRKGQRALVLCMPVTCRRKTADGPSDDATGTPDAEGQTFTRFVYRPNWFVLSQTDGQPVEPRPMPEWDQTRALQVLDITEEPFALTDGNCQGYAHQRTIVVSPLAELPHKTRFHELAHVVLGHTDEAAGGLTDSETTPRSLKEVEAEAVALVCSEALGLPGSEHCRGYIQAWNARRGAEPIPERSAQKVFKAADQILRAGRADAAETVQ
jgi:antirestriction protein ArdC